MASVDDVGGLYMPIWWNVGFLPRSGKARFWDFLTKEWCRHVMCWGYSAHQKAWVVVDATENLTKISVIPDADWNDFLAQLIERKVTILQVKAGGCRLTSHRFMQTCSTIVARIIGIEGRSLTPLALYKTLIEQDAIVKTDPYHVNQSQTSRRRSGN